MYQNYFLDYASYVILERAVPALEDGLKPVQRRILHAMFAQHDGRYHKVANLIGQTMQYHPHGDAAIGEALVNMGQKDLLIDCQGNWGDFRTGDSAAAPRYIEARLTKFALDVAFNPDTTVWQMSYDGRKREPVNLPMKFPLVVAQGAEGIAVGLSTKILPHNFVEIRKGCIAVLKGRKAEAVPDFLPGGLIDAANYNGGARGGRSACARIREMDKKTLQITEIPFGVTTGDLIESILKANEKGQIKIKKVTDKVAADIDDQWNSSRASADVTIDTTLLFTDCSEHQPQLLRHREQQPLFLRRANRTVVIHRTHRGTAPAGTGNTAAASKRNSTSPAERFLSKNASTATSGIPENLGSRHRHHRRRPEKIHHHGEKIFVAKKDDIVHPHRRSGRKTTTDKTPPTTDTAYENLLARREIEFDTIQHPTSTSAAANGSCNVTAITRDMKVNTRRFLSKQNWKKKRRPNHLRLRNQT